MNLGKAKYGTWNLRSINEQEKQAKDEFERAQLTLLALMEIKKKRQDIMQLDNGQ